MLSLITDAGDLPIEIGVALIASVILAGFGAACWWFLRAARRDRHLGNDIYVPPDTSDDPPP